MLELGMMMPSGVTRSDAAHEAGKPGKEDFT